MVAALALIQASPYHPHGFCYLWESDLVWTHVVGDGLTALAYYSIPVGLVYVVRRRRDIPFDWMFVAFAAFILACGTTHVMAIWNLWHADFWAAAWVKVVTAGASIATAALMVPLIPKVLEVPSTETLQRKNEELAAAHAEIAHLNRELRARVADLESANSDLEAFSHSVSHDLKAPLRSMEGFSTAVLEDCGQVLDERCTDYVERVALGAKRLSALIDDLLEYSQIALRDVSPEHVRLEPLVSDVLTSLARTIQEVGARVETSVEVPEVSGHRGLITTVLTNLVSNALKYAEPTRVPTVRIRAWRTSPEWVRIKVSDNGIGIAVEDRERIFALFERLHGVDRYGGTGVGLAVVARAVSRLGGRIEVESEVGVGSEFTVILPASAS